MSVSDDMQDDSEFVEVSGDEDDRSSSSLISSSAIPHTRQSLSEGMNCSKWTSLEPLGRGSVIFINSICWGMNSMGQLDCRWSKWGWLKGVWEMGDVNFFSDTPLPPTPVLLLLCLAVINLRLLQPFQPINHWITEYGPVGILLYQVDDGLGPFRSSGVNSSHAVIHDPLLFMNIISGGQLNSSGRCWIQTREWIYS